jgi:hypothetical protein
MNKKGTGEVHPITDHEGTEKELGYCCALFYAKIPLTHYICIYIYIYMYVNTPLFTLDTPTCFNPPGAILREY